MISNTNIETVNLVKASDIVPEPVNWLWEGWLAAGKIHIIAGSPGVGKTTICLSLAAVLSVGGKWPDNSMAEAGHVVIWSGEDDPKDTLVPRLIAAGADCDRVHFIDGISKGTKERVFDPAKDSDPLYRKLEEVGNVRLLIVDPIVSAIQGDSHKNAEVRRGLQPLVELAESLECAVLGVTHLSKGVQNRAPLEQITGSLAFGALARIVLMVSKKDKDDGSTEHILCRAKSNIGSDSGGFTYEMQESALEDHPDISTSTIQWGEAIEGTAQDLFAGSEDLTEKDRSALQEAKDYLTKLLSEGQLPWTDISEGATSLRISNRTLTRAKKALSIRHKKIGKCSYWLLPEQVSQTDVTVPTQNLAQLAQLPEYDEITELNSTVPSEPTVPTTKVAQLKQAKAAIIGNRLNNIIVQGREDLRKNS